MAMYKIKKITISDLTIRLRQNNLTAIEKEGTIKVMYEHENHFYSFTLVNYEPTVKKLTYSYCIAQLSLWEEKEHSELRVSYQINTSYWVINIIFMVLLFFFLKNEILLLELVAICFFVFGMIVILGVAIYHYIVLQKKIGTIIPSLY